MSVVVGIFTIIGGAASIVMAFAAVAALSLWRKQIAGASHHDLAKRLAGSLRKAAIARREVLSALRTLQADPSDLNFAIKRLFAPDVLKRGGAALGDAVDELEALEGEVAVQWGDDMLGLVEVVRSECKGLFIFAASEHDPSLKQQPRGYLATIAPPRIAPSYIGRTFEKALDLYSDLAQDWLAVHLGREGATVMDAATLKRKCADVAAEVARLAEPEQAALDRDKQQWLERVGGLEGLKRLLAEERAEAARADEAQTANSGEAGQTRTEPADI